MLSSPTFSNSSTPSPLFYVDNISSNLVDNITNYSTSYYHSPSPLVYNDVDNYFGEFITNHELAIIQQSMLVNSDDKNNNDTVDITGHSSMLELDNKVDSNKSGDQESEIINGIVEDNGDINHIKRSSTNNDTSTDDCHHRHGLISKKGKRSSNKDRHSKIRTAQGLRDRRIRLSLKVAHPFFRLRDMLGYDRASTTVEWLLMQSKPAIDELLQSKHGSPPSGVTTTKCTAASSNSDDWEVDSTTIEAREEVDPEAKRSVLSTIKEKPPKHKRRRTKLERNVAREKAKIRTLEKMQSKGNITNSITPSRSYPQSSDVSQNVPSYRISPQQNIMGGPQ